MGDDVKTRKWDYSQYLYTGAILMVIGVGMLSGGTENDNDVLTILGIVAAILGLSGFLIGAIARGVELGVRAATDDLE